MNAADWVALGLLGPVTIDFVVRLLLWVCVWPAGHRFYPEDDVLYVGTLCFWWLQLALLLMAAPFLMLAVLSVRVRRWRLGVCPVEEKIRRLLTIAQCEAASEEERSFAYKKAVALAEQHAIDISSLKSVDYWSKSWPSTASQRYVKDQR